MAEPSRPISEVSELRQVCIVVHDLQKSMERYQSILGIGPWEVLDFDDSTVSDMTYHGKPAQQKFRVATTMVGPMQLELIQPVEGDTVYSDFLKEHGEGLHHLGVVIVDNLDEAMQTSAKAGLACLQSGRIVSGHFAGARYAYLDAVNSLGTIIELAEMPKELLPY